MLIGNVMRGLWIETGQQVDYVVWLFLGWSFGVPEYVKLAKHGLL